MVDMSVQQVSNIEKGIGNNGKPMTSNYKTYQKIAYGIGMEETDFMRLLNDNVLVNPTEEENPATESDGMDKDVNDDLTISEWDRKYLAWLHAQSPEKRRAILILQDAPEDLL